MRLIYLLFLAFSITAVIFSVYAMSFYNCIDPLPVACAVPGTVAAVPSAVRFFRP